MEPDQKSSSKHRTRSGYGHKGMESTFWHNQDILQLSVSQWIKELRNPSTFNDEALRMVRFVYRQNEHESTASDIAKEFSSTNKSVHYNKISAINRKVAKELYKKYGVEPPLDNKGQRKYWNTVLKVIQIPR